MNMQVLGHRGARFEAPENTVPGFQYAVDMGLKACEFDIRMSKDGHLVIIHDDTVDRTTNGTGDVASLTLEELQALDARSIFPDFPEQCRIPTFGEVLDVVKGMDHIQVEIKSDTNERLEIIVPMVVAEIIERGLEEPCTIISFNVHAIEIARREAPRIGRGFIGNWDTPEFLETAQALGCIDAGPHHVTADRELVSKAKSMGIRITGWPTNSAEELASVITLDPEYICTDSPTLISGLLAAKIA